MERAMFHHRPEGKEGTNETRCTIRDHLFFRSFVDEDSGGTVKGNEKERWLVNEGVHRWSGENLGQREERKRRRQRDSCAMKARAIYQDICPAKRISDFPSILSHKSERTDSRRERTRSDEER